MTANRKNNSAIILIVLAASLALFSVYKSLPNAVGNETFRFKPLEFSRLTGSCTVLDSHPRCSTNLRQDKVSPQVTSDDSRFRVHSEGYPPLASIEYYPWDYIVEPHRDTIIDMPETMKSNGRRYYWRISKVYESGDISVVGRYSDSSSITFKFMIPTQIYEVTLEVQSEDGSVITAKSVHMMCKYVRREIRSLTDQDRKDFFYALGQISSGTADSPPGNLAISANAKTLQYMMVKHIHTQDCSPFHNGNGFFTSHAAFTLELDQALQTVVPSTLIPYWDYTIDASLYENDWYIFSPMFKDDWFGAATPLNEDHHVTTSWIESIDVPINFFGPVHNSYGLVTNTINNNPSLKVTRAHSFCEMENRIPLPSCSEMLGCLKQRSMEDLRDCMEGQLHRDLHMGIGGCWDCHVSFKKFLEEFPDTEKLMAKIGMQIMGITNALWQHGELTCPENCPITASFEECRCICKAFDNEMLSALSWEDAFDVLDRVGIVRDFKKYLRPAKSSFNVSANHVEDELFSSDVKPETRYAYNNKGYKINPLTVIKDIEKTTLNEYQLLEQGKDDVQLESELQAKYTFNTDTPLAADAQVELESKVDPEDPNWPENKLRPQWDGISDVSSEALWKMLLELGCNPGKIGNMGTGASSGDPLFWPIHPFFDRLWSYMRLNLHGEFDTMDWDWEDSETSCYGHRSYDALPFSRLFGESSSQDVHYYSNSDLIQHFDPRNPQVPYVYDNFLWEHC